MVEAPQIQVCSHRKWKWPSRHNQHHQDDGQKKEDVSVSMISRLLHCIEKMIIAICGTQEAEKKAQKLRAWSITIQCEWWAKRVGCNTWWSGQHKCMHCIWLAGCNKTNPLFWKPINTMFWQMQKKTCRYCKRSWRQAVWIGFTFPHCEWERQARIKRFLKMKWLLEKDMIVFGQIEFAVDPASPDGDQSKEVTAIHYEDSEWNKKIKILSITTPQPWATQ